MARLVLAFVLAIFFGAAQGKYGTAGRVSAGSGCVHARPVVCSVHQDTHNAVVW